jgi:hypothetical protein
VYRSLIPVASIASIASIAAVACRGEDPKPPPKTAPPWTAVGEAYEPGALLSIWGSGANDVWVAGGELGKPVVLHFDGAAWTRNDPPVAQQLWWIHGFAGGPIFVAGEGGAIARHTGGTWEVLESGHPDTIFFGIWGAAQNDMWAVGSGDVVVHYDGTAWTRVRIPYLDMKPASAQKNLFKVWGANAKDVVIVGDSGLALHYDGEIWTRVDTGLTGSPLFTVRGRSATDVWAVGGLGAPALVHWNGTAWAEVELPESAPLVIQGVWTAPGQPVLVSGHEGWAACRNDDGTWAEIEPVTRDALHAIWGDGQGAFWASGGNIVAILDDYRGTLLVAGRTAPRLP